MYGNIGRITGRQVIDRRNLIAALQMKIDKM